MYRNFNDPKYVEWRNSVYKRDKYKCQWPNCTLKSKLNAHHINKWSEFPSLRFVVDNGITLCRYHHKLIKDQEHIYAAVFLKIIADKHGKK